MSQLLAAVDFSFAADDCVWANIQALFCFAMCHHGSQVHDRDSLHSRRAATAAIHSPAVTHGVETSHEHRLLSLGIARPHAAGHRIRQAADLQLLRAHPVHLWPHVCVGQASYVFTPRVSTQLNIALPPAL